jgi:hypothetical protein
MNKEISLFIANHGVSLSASNSNEKGYTKLEIFQLLELLQKQGIKPLGLEKWDIQSENNFRMDSLAGWYSANEMNINENFVELRALLSNKQDGQSIYTLQF